METSVMILRIIAAVIFAGLGYVVSHKIPQDSKLTAWIVFIVGVLLAADTFRYVSLVAVEQYSVYLNSSLYGFGVGVLAGFVGKKRKRGNLP